MTYGYADDGAFDLDRYDSNGTQLQRYIGFSRITTVRMYDHHTALIAEEERDRISALTLGGQIVWTIALHRPRSVEVIGPNRFLVAQDNPSKVAEVNRAGEVSWALRSPLVDAKWAVRLPDGNTAVVPAPILGVKPWAASHLAAVAQQRAETDPAFRKRLTRLQSALLKITTSQT